MSDTKKIETALRERLSVLTARANDIDDELSEAPNPDWEEQALESEDDEVLEHVGELAVDEIKKINTALAKIEAGTYGICELCDKPIPSARLEALPYASTCVACAEGD